MAAPTLIAAARQFLLGYAPFSLMEPADLDFLVEHLELEYFAAGELLIGPDAGAPRAMWIVRQGLVEGWRHRPGSPAQPREALLQLLPGESFPVGALLADRPVVSEYRAAGDVFCWRLAKVHFDLLVARSPVFLDFCKRRTAALLDLSRKALQASYANQITQWRSMNEPLAVLLGRPVVHCAPDEPLHKVFERMEAEGVGAMIVVESAADGGGRGSGLRSDRGGDRHHSGVESDRYYSDGIGKRDAAGAARSAQQVVGIFTRQDVIGRVVLAQAPLDAPIRTVMSSPVHTMDAGDSVGDAILRMAELRIRHIPIMKAGSLSGIVTERDLFALQRRTLLQISHAIGRAADVDALAIVAADIRHLSRSLVAQGVAADFVTRLISRLNDQLSERLIGIVAASHGLSLGGLCWISLGSEGREEQTIATDQDNALIVGEGAGNDARAMSVVLAFADEVNRALDRCGYPLCLGGIMAGNPRWCLRLEQWFERFQGWIDSGDPLALLNANIFFDFRGLGGDLQLAAALRDHLTPRVRRNARFLKQMSDNALRSGPPASWAGGMLDGLFGRDGSQIDLKAQGTRPFVDAARVLALAHGVRATGTAGRLAQLAEAGVVRPEEARDWSAAFHFIQSLRLLVQHRPALPGEHRERPNPNPNPNPNMIDVRELSEIDRRILKESFRQARKLQQRLAADYPGQGG